MKTLIWPVVRITLVISCLLAGFYGYSTWRCSSVRGQRPVFGDFTVHCEWNYGARVVKVFEVGTKKEPDNPITRILLLRLARGVANDVMRPAAFFPAVADFQIKVYGDIFPCAIEKQGMFRIVYPTHPLPKNLHTD